MNATGSRPATGAGPVVRGAASAITVAFVGVLVLWPLAAILRRGFAPAGSIELAAISEVLGSARSRSVLWFTVVQAGWSTLATLLVGLPAAWAVSRPFRGRAFVLGITAAAFATPTVVMGLAWRSVLDRGLLAVVCAHVAFNVAVVVHVVGTAWSGMDPRPAEAARTLGASKARAWYDITLPRLRGSIAAATLLTFLFSFTSYGVIVVVGSNRQSTIESEIARLSRNLQFDRAGVLALVQLVVVIIVATTARRAERTVVSETAASAGRVRSLRRTLSALPAALVAVVPFAVLVRRVMFVDGRPSARALAALHDVDLRVGATPIRALGQSVVVAAVAVCVTMVVGLAAIAATAGPSWIARVVDVAVIVPLGVSAVTLGYGYLITFDEAPLRLRDHWWIVPLAHAAVAVPFVVRYIRPGLRSVDASVVEAAATLGADARRRLTSVVLPLLRPAIVGAAAFAAAISLGEFGATSMLARRGEPTATSLIGQLLGRPGDAPRLAADALALALALVIVLVLAAGNRLTRTQVAR